VLTYARINGLATTQLAQENQKLRKEPLKIGYARKRMSILTSESPIALENLDDHLKALLKLKLREFVHLNPCFSDIPSIDVTRYARPVEAYPAPAFLRAAQSPDCPNLKHRSGMRRRAARPFAV
jgi:hypothetical protein